MPPAADDLSARDAWRLGDCCPGATAIEPALELPVDRDEGPILGVRR